MSRALGRDTSSLISRRRIAELTILDRLSHCRGHGGFAKRLAVASRPLVPLKYFAGKKEESWWRLLGISTCRLPLLTCTFSISEPWKTPFSGKPIFVALVTDCAGQVEAAANKTQIERTSRSKGRAARMGPLSCQSTGRCRLGEDGGSR
jgi:hypothetical protein